MLQFIDSTRFMGSSLSNLVNNLSEGIRRIKFKFGHDDKKGETYKIKCKYGNCFFEDANFKDDFIEYKYLCCNKNYQNKFARFSNTYNFLIMTVISLFHCCKKVFILMNIWMIGKNPMKHHYLRKENFTVT